MADRNNEPSAFAGFLEIAREEFWIVAKSFFAPVYGPLLVWKRLLRLTRRVDQKALTRLNDPVYTPAE